MNKEQALNTIANLMATPNNTVVVTGAGISTEAGIPDFRGPNGIYRQLGEDKVMEVININAFRRDPEAFYRFYRESFQFPQVDPSPAHLQLAEWEKRGLVRAVVTQNIDNLHQRAGSKNVIPVHGTADRFLCTKKGCGKVFDTDFVKNTPGVVPYCPECGSVIKPDVVLFGESIHNYVQAQNTVMSASLLIVIGSSLTVFPLAEFVMAYSSMFQNLVIINKGLTAADHLALVKLDPDNTGEALREIDRRIMARK